MYRKLYTVYNQQKPSRPGHYFGQFYTVCHGIKETLAKFFLSLNFFSLLNFGSLSSTFQTGPCYAHSWFRSLGGCFVGLFVVEKHFGTVPLRLDGCRCRLQFFGNLVVVWLSKQPSSSVSGASRPILETVVVVLSLLVLGLLVINLLVRLSSEPLSNRLRPNLGE